MQDSKSTKQENVVPSNQPVKTETVVGSVDTRLQGALVGDTNQNAVPSATQDKKHKKRISKMAIFFSLFFLVIAVLIFLFLKFGKDSTIVPSGTKGELVWWGIQHDISVYKPLIDKFEKDNPNIKIIYRKQAPNDYQERLVTALASGEGPDIFEIHNTWPVMLKNNLAALPASVMSKDEFSKSFYPIIVSNLSLEKGIVGMPLEYDALTLYINEDVFASALKSPPEIWDELQITAAQLTQTSGKDMIIQGGAALGITENVDHWQEIVGLMLFQNGVNPAKPVGSASVSALSFYKDFSGRKIWNSTLPNSTAAFSRGELAMYFGPTRRASEIIKANPNLKFRTAKLPQLRKNKPDDPVYSYATYWVQAVAERSKAKDTAWTFLKFVSREDSLREINENVAKYETFGRVYPRPEMNTGMAQDPILGSIVHLAYNARSFYLADNTFDGKNGINTSVNNLYKGIIDGNITDKILLSKSQELGQILAKYGVVVK